MKKTSYINIENLIYLYPVSFFFPTIFSFFDIFLVNKIRLDHFIILFLCLYMFYKFFKGFWLPNLKIFLIFFAIILHVIKGLIFTDFSGEVDVYKLIGYLESYISFAMLLLFVDFYYSTYSNKAKNTLINLVNCFVISSFFVLAVVILLALNPYNINLVKLFSSDTDMVRRAYGVGRYIGPIAQPIESGFYAGIGMLVCCIFWKYNFTNKKLILLGFITFNIIGFLSGSKIYLLAINIVMGLFFFFYLKTKKKIYFLFLIVALLFKIILIAVTTLTYKSSKNSSIVYKFYSMKYYNLNTYVNKNLQEILKIMSGGRFKFDQPDQIKGKNQLDQIKGKNQLDQIKGKNQLEKIKESKQSFFTHIGPLDSQHKMIKTHGGNISLFFLLLFYVYLFYLIFKIHFKSNNLGIILLVLTSLVIATSTGFPVFFGNKVFVICCIIINLIFILSEKKRLIN